MESRGTPPPPPPHPQLTGDGARARARASPVVYSNYSNNGGGVSAGTSASGGGVSASGGGSANGGGTSGASGSAMTPLSASANHMTPGPSPFAAAALISTAAVAVVRNATQHNTLPFRRS